MRKQGEKGNCVIWLSKDDTYNWAHRPGCSWPCSTLSGHRLMVSVSNDDIDDLTVDGKYPEGWFDGNELDAILADFGARGER